MLAAAAAAADGTTVAAAVAAVGAASAAAADVRSGVCCTRPQLQLEVSGAMAEDGCSFQAATQGCDSLGGEQLGLCDVEAGGDGECGAREGCSPSGHGVL